MNIFVSIFILYCKQLKVLQKNKELNLILIFFEVKKCGIEVKITFYWLFKCQCDIREYISKSQAYS